MRKKQTLISKDFPKRLKQLRLEKNWSQGQVAQKIEVELERISKYERGVLSPTTDMAIKLASLFEVSLDYLLREEFDNRRNKIENEELQKRSVAFDKLPEKDQTTLLDVIDTYIHRRKLKEKV